ncbi:unnamed protein product [Rotaria socialis]|uniref:Cysteine and tyrosine-rich protein 1 n=4 Tax=Rotaria TaxID=231623 RepID=A0A816ZZU9_9BILA|nr:unnamed protein product [Rotaria magnacalcarata]CAF3033022.1 unnamed protein product [Rotaria socialis]CAF1592630.1 unnamed protein product [Rotaria magnacalcarata]CAF2067915.1 unnamed protein product [Rotaria magnacalcarata]CAF2131431.1 unnamed protein product [Rotaria magnacalcarata]
MSSLTSLAIVSIFIFSLSSVSSDCTSCCNYNIGCSTAYKGGPARSTCGSYAYCNSYYYWGNLTLAGLIGVIAGSIFGCIFLIALCHYLCKRQRRHTGAPVILLPPTFQNPGIRQAPPPYVSSTKA